MEEGKQTDCEMEIFFMHMFLLSACHLPLAQELRKHSLVSLALCFHPSTSAHLIVFGWILGMDRSSTLIPHVPFDAVTTHSSYSPHWLSLFTQNWLNCVKRESNTLDIENRRNALFFFFFFPLMMRETNRINELLEKLISSLSLSIE